MIRMSVVAVIAVFCAAPLLAQEAPPVPPAAPPPAVQAQPAPAPRPPAPPVVPARQVRPTPPVPEDVPRVVVARQPAPTQNVRIELAFTDSTAESKKTISMLIADGRAGRIRSEEQGRRLNVDATAEGVSDGRILLNLTIDFFPGPRQGSTPNQVPGPGPVQSMINESLSVLVPNGQPTLISESADPMTDRKVSVEVTATIVK